MSSPEHPVSSLPKDDSHRSREPSAVPSTMNNHKSASPERHPSHVSPPAVPKLEAEPIETVSHAQNQEPSIVLSPLSKSLSPPNSRHTPLNSPPRSRSAEGERQIHIDPSLLDAAGEPDNTVSQKIRESYGASAHPSAGTPHPDVYRLAPTGQRPWNLSTSNLQVESQPPTSLSSSPATPGLGIDGLYHGRPFDMSRQSSTTDLGSYYGATKGMSTTASSEDGYDDNVEMDRGDNEGEEDDGGIPPPRPKKSHARKQPPGHIKRARNAFILFRKHVTDSNLIPPSVEVKHQNISVVAAKMWREAPQEIRQKFQEQARIEKEEHQRKYPGYRYQPVFRRTDIIRRRVRKDAAEDDKVEAVAEALIKGKAGRDLEQEIRDQMVTRSEASESEAESSRNSTSSRRRRREVGQLSKGAIRAQRAQARAKQMRQNLLGSNLLNMSMYNAAAQRGQIPSHPGAQHHLQYPMADSYMPVGYDLDGRPIQYDAGMYAAQGMDGSEMYRLPPLDGMNMGYDTWNNQAGVDYWSGAEYTQDMGNDGHGHPPIETYFPPSLSIPDYNGEGHAQTSLQLNEHTGHNEYQLAPMMDPHAQGVHPLTNGAEPNFGDREKNLLDPRLREWARDGQQTPSGHVVFNERLFDGALGSAELPALLDGVGRDDELADFNEAMVQANEGTHW